MKKTWIIQGSNTQHETYDAAVDAAKRRAQRDNYDTLNIYELVAVVKTPAPEFEVVKL